MSDDDAGLLDQGGQVADRPLGNLPMAADDRRDALAIVIVGVRIAPGHVAQRLEIGRLKETAQMHDADVQLGDHAVQVARSHIGLFAPLCRVDADRRAIDRVRLAKERLRQTEHRRGGADHVLARLLDAVLDPGKLGGVHAKLFASLLLLESSKLPRQSQHVSGIAHFRIPECGPLASRGGPPCCLLACLYEASPVLSSGLRPLSLTTDRRGVSSAGASRLGNGSTCWAPPCMAYDHNAPSPLRAVTCKVS